MEPVFKRRYYNELFREAVLSRRYVGVEELGAMTEYPSWKTLFYAHSYSLVSFLIEEMGMSAFIKFAAYVKDNGMAAGIRKFTEYRTPRALQKAWIKRVRKGVRE